MPAISSVRLTIYNIADFPLTPYKCIYNICTAKHFDVKFYWFRIF